MEARNKALVFLGSGVSVDSGMPRVSDLTEKLFSITPEDLTIIHSFYPSLSPIESPKRHRGVQDFLRILHEWAVCNGMEDVNYEDLHSFCTKIIEYRNAPRKDPTIRGLVEFSHGKVCTTDFYEQQDRSLCKCAILARDFIEFTVKQELLVPERGPKALDSILDLIDLLGPENCDIITLNHDTLIEQLLENRHNWTDGFDSKVDVYREDPEGNRIEQRLDCLSEKSFLDSRKLRIVKPHGSCNWFRLKPNGVWETGILRDGWHQDLFDSDNRLIEDNPFESGLLSGSFTKESSYLRGSTGIMYRHAYRILHEYDRVICSGYGWRDPGINHMFLEWIQINSDKRIAVLHSDKSTDSQAIHRLVDKWTAAYLSRTILHPFWLSESDPLAVLGNLKVETRR